jgi:hypothetical protein
VDRPLLESSACLNCGATLHGPFCAACGQEDRPRDPRLGEVVAEFARELSALDGRIVRSVRRLFFSPGFLTLEHFEGRRTRWVSPVRLYLIFSVACFAIAAFAGVAPLDITVSASGSPDNDQESVQAIQRLGFSSEEEMRRAIDRAQAEWVPRAMFVLVPLFGWLVSRVRKSSSRRYPHHVIFGLHVFAAFFGVQALAVGAGYLVGRPWAVNAFAIASITYAVIYLVRAMKTVYGGTTARAIVHSLIVLFFYWVATVVTAIVIVLPVLYRP